MAAGLLRSWLRQGIGPLVGVVMGATLVSIVSAHQGPTFTVVVHGCQTNTGTVKIILASQSCGSNETPVHWLSTVVTTPAGSGLVGGNSNGDVTLSLATNCTAGELLKWNGSVWVCAADLDTNSGGDITGVTAGTGLAGGGQSGDVTVGINTAGSSAGQVLTSTGTGVAWQNPASAGGDITAVNTAAGSGLQGGAPSGDVDLRLMNCPAGQVVKSDGATPANWTCQPDNNTTYTAGPGLTLTGTQFSSDTTYVQRRVSGNCTAGSFISAINADGTVVCGYGPQSFTYGIGQQLAGTFGASTVTILEIPLELSVAAHMMATGSLAATSPGGESFQLEIWDGPTKLIIGPRGHADATTGDHGEVNTVSVATQLAAGSHSIQLRALCTSTCFSGSFFTVSGSPVLSVLVLPGS